jgi:hypothetical protein
MKKTPLLIALTNPVNLAMLALTAAASLCAAWWLVFPGLILWLVMVLIIAREPTLQFSHVLENRPPLAQRFQKKFDPINRALIRLFNTIAASKPRTRRLLQPVLKTAVELIDQVYTLCLQLTPVENNQLVTQSSGGLLLELENIRTKIEKAEDPVIKREYRQAYDSIKERLDQQDKLATQLDRMDAQLVSFKNEMDNLLAEVVSLQSKSKAVIHEQASEIVKRLNQEGQAFLAFTHEIHI